MRRGCALVGWLALLSAGCSEGDEDRIGHLVSTITGEVSSESISSGLEWLDPERLTIDVQARGIERVYGPGDTDALRAESRRALSRYLGQNLRAMRQSIQVDGDEARVTLQLLSDQGVANVELGLRKLDDTTWLVNRVRVR